MNKEIVSPEITSGVERAKKIFNYRCVRCDGDLSYDTTGHGLCDDCVKEVKKSDWDKNNSFI